MKWKDVKKLIQEFDDCSPCPLLEDEICPGGTTCYGDQPIEPPCFSFYDDTDLDEWVKEYFEREKRYEEYQEKLIREKKAKEEKAKKAAETRHAMRLYCMAEIVELKSLKKRLAEYEKAYSLAQSLAFAINSANEMFRYPERVKEKPEIQQRIEDLKVQIAETEACYKANRKEFYAKRKAEKGETI